jgi:tetratricopeptide (TPR) repeat protein
LSTAAMANGSWKLAEAEQIANDALTISNEIGSQRVRERALRQLGAVYRRQGRLKLALEMFERTAQVAAGATPGTKLGRQRFRCWLLYELGALGDARRLYDEKAPQSADGLPSETAVPYAMVLGEQGHLAEARILLEETARAREAAGVSRHGWPLGVLARVLQNMGELDAAQDVYDRLARSGQRRGGAYIELLIRRGNFAEAELAVEEPLRRFEEAGAADYLLAMSALRLRALVGQGKLSEAQSEALRAGNLARISENVPVRLAAQTALAVYEAAAGRWEAARQSIAGVLEEADRRGYVATALEARLAQAKIEVEADAVAAAMYVETLERDAVAKGFHGIAAEARLLSPSVKKTETLPFAR